MGLTSFFSTILSKPLDKRLTALTCHQWGNMENCLKEQKLGLHSDRTSTHTFEGNQLRLWFASIAYILINALREQCLAKTEFKNATVETIRAKLLKLGAVITISKRRVLIAISSACPYQEIFTTVYKCLSQLPSQSIVNNGLI
ncbi:transposase [Plectonema radiosum]|uniref:transposase n=1 Tax=Plectonema radiosum TaxID=945768 RepID=UPI0035C8876A